MTTFGAILSNTELDEPQIVAKTADQTVNNSIVLVDDTHLVFPVLNTKTAYFIEYTLLVSSAANADIRLNWTIPTGATMYFAPGWQSSTPYWDVFTAAGGTGASLFTAGGADFTFGCGAATVQGCRITCILVMGANNGNVQLKWAQSTQQASDSKLLKGSIVRYQGK